MERINQKGFSLIELMIAVGISSVIALGLATTINHAMLVSQTADTKANLTSVVSSTAGTAFNVITCTAAVTKTAQNYGDTFQFGDLSTGADLANYNLTVKSLTYANSVLVATGWDNTKVYYGTITLVASAKRNVYGGQTFAPRSIAAVYLTVNSLGVVTACGPMMPYVPAAPTPAAPIPSATTTFAFDADPKVCENFPIKARCTAPQKIVVTQSAYGDNCAGVAPNYGQETVQALCNGQSSCDFTAGNANNCTSQGVFIDPSVDCPKSFHMSYHCE